MSTWRDKAEARFKSSLAPGERETRRGEGLIGLKDAFFVLTNKRIFIFWAGTTKWSEPNTRDIDLKHIVSAYCEPNPWPKGPNLVIESRTGIFSVALTKTAKKESGLWPKWILEAQDALSSQPQTSGPPPEAAERIKRRWGLLNALRPLGTKEQVGSSYGTDSQLSQAKGVIFTHLHGIDEVRESAEMFSISILTGVKQGRFTFDHLASVMGADQEHLSRAMLTPSDALQVSRLADFVSVFLDNFHEGPMWDLYQQRDDLACEILTWVIVAIHRLGSEGLGPEFPTQPPL